MEVHPGPGDLEPFAMAYKKFARMHQKELKTLEKDKRKSM